ncbi:hypothetical protein EYF80_013163 [Liparis tanakae]|uniref:Uncharacterized protein n=1 Tax=Liparis tanakae TaxID=230148 RepID=A0A4Z2IG18_9TELE|nr:hypothetical protein EYF80_013163 [Liparis tanakae]
MLSRGLSLVVRPHPSPRPAERDRHECNYVTIFAAGDHRKCASAAAGLLPLRSSLRLGQRGRGGGLWTGGPATEGRVFTLTL